MSGTRNRNPKLARKADLDLECFQLLNANLSFIFRKTIPSY
jgi:hypothetical protein